MPYVTGYMHMTKAYMRLVYIWDNWILPTSFNVGIRHLYQPIIRSLSTNEITVHPSKGYLYNITVLFWHVQRFVSYYKYMAFVVTPLCDIYSDQVPHQLCAILITWYLTKKVIVSSFSRRSVLAFGYCSCLRLSVCVSVRVCGKHLLVRTITHHPFNLGSPNLDHRCKRPWLRSQLFCGVIDIDLKGQI